MRTVIFVGGVLRPGKAVSAALASAELVLAADSGAATALAYHLTPSIIVGDLDSLNESDLNTLIARGSQVVRANVEKDETDTELAIQIALAHGATDITLLGGIEGERFDHAMANILLLAAFPDVPLRIIDGPTTCWLLCGPGSAHIHGQPGDLLSLLPLTADATGIRSSGLYYPLRGETLRFGRPRGVSNALTSTAAEVTLEGGLLLIIHTNVNELNSAS